ncbi:hypothetical protein [Actinoplanes sp. RD1]|uniref:hypothetical protein n=1 Tax=Actinoplanes sp. RD1 TaxID=3064538 RepID=UPI0027404F4E|nr:hypothetical protein [Actinoplanes sp. RD1]
MSVLDTTAAWVGRVLDVLPPEAARFLSLPVLFAVVCLGAVLLWKRVLPPLVRLAVWLTGCGLTLAGAVLLLAEMGAASCFRQAGRKPPAAAYHLGDAVASWVAGFATRSEGLRTGSARIARVPWGVIVGFAAAYFWLWNYRHCPDGAAAGCVRPVGSWLAWVSETADSDG